MADSAFGPGTIVRVRQFHYPAQPLWVEMVSSVDEDVGSGATARIYKGRAGPSGYTYDVALKVIPDLLNNSKQQILEQLIRREVDAISRLSERQMRRILPFIGVASMQFHMVIVSKFMRNGNLLQYFCEKPFADRQRLVIQVAEGVYWLHEFAKLVHGDLKCENVLVNDDDDAVIADFGLTTLVEQETLNITTISAIRGLGTLPFAAPELVNPPPRTEASGRPRSKTPASDVYAFGMLILQAFSGRRPWPDLPQLAIVLKVGMIQEKHPRPSDEVTMLGLTDSWWAVCLRCWESEPPARPTMEWVWETLEAKRRKPRALPSGSQMLLCIAVASGGKCSVISGSDDGTITIWDLCTGEAIGRLHGHVDRVIDIAVSPDGRKVCSCGRNGTLRRWGLESSILVRQPMTGHKQFALGVTFSPDGMRIVSWSDNTVRQWDATTGEALGDVLRGHPVPIMSVALSPDGDFIATGSNRGTIRLWTFATGVILGVLRHEMHEEIMLDAIRTICFSPDRLHLMSGCEDGTIQIWDIQTEKLVYDIKAHIADVSSVAVSPSGRYIASGSLDMSICIWDAQTGDALGPPLRGPRGWIHSVAFSSNGRSVVSGSEDGTVRIWDLFE